MIFEVFNRLELNKGGMHENLPEFLDTLSDWVWEMDTNGVHTYSNAAITKILGYTPAEIVGMHVSSIWPPEMATEEAITLFNRELKDAIPWKFFRGKFRHKDGSILTLESSGMPLYDKNNVLTGYRGVDRDIHETIRKEQELVASREKYQQLSERFELENNFKTLLLDIITHDILNPVNIISGLSEQMVNELPDDERLQLILRSSKRLSTVIRSASTLAAITNGETIAMERLDLAKLLTETCADYQHQMSQSNIELVCNIPEKCVVVANPIIEEIFKNYLDNAYKYARQSKRIEVNTREIGGDILCEVADEGETISDGDRERIFRRGVRLSTGLKGSGLGLAIVKQIADAHGAEVGIRPNFPKGNVFFLKLSPGGKPAR